jgi:hypothetical protein
MATLPQRILSLVGEIQGLTDRQIATRLLGASSPQQSVNIAARGLANKGQLIRRTREDGLIGNYLNEGNTTPAPQVANIAPVVAPSKVKAMRRESEFGSLIARFVESLAANGTEIYNEFSLQHELGQFLRSEFPGYLVQFERNVTFFAPSKDAFTKREIDLVVYSKDKSDLKFAIELKYPRNGQYPEAMYSFCKDIAFAEELNAAGFAHTALLIFADDPLFYSGPGDGIYGYFRTGHPLTGCIKKPTGAVSQEVLINGTYIVSWSAVSAKARYALVEVGANER